MNLKLKTVFLGVAALVLFACAKEKTESVREVQEKILDAYIQSNWPSAQKLESGLTILNLTGGYGMVRPGTNDGIYIHYNTYTLDGICQSTTDSLKARMLGTYNPSLYYGPTLFILDATTIVGLRELFGKMNQGATATAIIPPWLTTSTSSGSGYSTRGQQADYNMIYEVKAGVVIGDIQRYQTDSLEMYSIMHFSPRIDSTARDYYFRNYTHPSGIPDADTIKSGTAVGVWYVGRLLDGYVFDTNIADTAKKYKIYDASKDYTPLRVTMRDSYLDMASSGSSSSNDDAVSSVDDSSLIPGFVKALKGMTYKDKAVVFFSSDWGYGANGNMSSGKGVPQYAMLRFDMQMAHKDDKQYPPTQTK